MSQLSSPRTRPVLLALAVVLLQCSLAHTAGASAGTLFGSSIHREPATEPFPAALGRYDARFGPEVLRIYFPGAPKPWSSPELNHGRGVVVSFKLPPRAVLAGTYDVAMRNWFATAPRNRTVWWSYWSEPEDDIKAGTFTAADYRAAFARLDALADRASNPMLRTTQVLMDWTLDRRSGRNWRTYYPGRAAIDVQAWDQYHYANPATCVYKSMSAHDANRPSYEISRAEGNDYAIAEIGSHVCIPQRPAWLTDIGAWARGRAVFVTYFDSTVGGDYRLTDPASQQAWRAVIHAVTPAPPRHDATRVPHQAVDHATGLPRPHRRPPALRALRGRPRHRRHRAAHAGPALRRPGALGDRRATLLPARREDRSARGSGPQRDRAPRPLADAGPLPRDDRRHRSELQPRSAEDSLVRGPCAGLVSWFSASRNQRRCDAPGPLELERSGIIAMRSA